MQISMSLNIYSKPSENRAETPNPYQIRMKTDNFAVETSANTSESAIKMNGFTTRTVPFDCGKIDRAIRPMLISPCPSRVSSPHALLKAEKDAQKPSCLNSKVAQNCSTHGFCVS